MSGLKSYLPKMGAILRMSPALIYERQRALVRLGLLVAGEGRGPGSGVPLTPDSVAVLLIALLATDNLSDTDDRVRVLSEAVPFARKYCPYTRATNFREAVARLLADQKLVAGVRWVTVQRYSMAGTIEPNDGKKSLFTGDECAVPQSAFYTETHLDPRAIEKIASDLADGVNK